MLPRTGGLSPAEEALPMLSARTSALALCFALGLGAAACGGGGSTGTGGTTTTSTPATTSMAGTNDPPMLADPKPAATAGGGLVLSWTEPNPCDTVEIERQDLVHPYPSSMHPPGAPQLTTPGTNSSIADTTATDKTTTYTYHARCVVGGSPSLWSNEVFRAGN
jgi:hypothetical protein